MNFNKQTTTEISNRALWILTIIAFLLTFFLVATPLVGERFIDESEQNIRSNGSLSGAR